MTKMWMERAQMVNMLLRVEELGRSNKSELCAYEGGSSHTKLLCIDSLEELGLIQVDRRARKSNEKIITVTDKGRRVCALLREMDAVINERGAHTPPLPSQTLLADQMNPIHLKSMSPIQ